MVGELEPALVVDAKLSAPKYEKIWIDFDAIDYTRSASADQHQLAEQWRHKGIV
jgi:hypothetical protein